MNAFTKEKVLEGQGRYYPGALLIRNTLTPLASSTTIQGYSHYSLLAIFPPPVEQPSNHVRPELTSGPKLGNREKVNCQPNIGRTSAPNNNRRATSIGECDVVIPFHVCCARAERRSTGAPRAGQART